ncbi:MAG: hypothetical protein ACXAC7_00850 [Candidatus Hodarchaeales archaeon]|jgi:hypothetical protein
MPVKEIKERKAIIPPKIPISQNSLGKRPEINLQIKTGNNEKDIVKLNHVVGVVNNSHKIDADFRPKSSFVNKRFRKVWRWIHSQPKSRKNFDSDTIHLARLDENVYYVIGGLRRVCALKHAEFSDLVANVFDYRDQYKKYLERQNAINKVNKEIRTRDMTKTRVIARRIRTPTPVLRAPPKE